MLCGRRPFRSEQIHELLRQVREDEPQPPRQVVRSIPRELERICLKAMAKRISDRYTTAGDLAEELRDQIRTGGPSVSVRVSGADSIETPQVESRATSKGPTSKAPPPVRPRLCSVCGSPIPSGVEECPHCEGSGLRSSIRNLAGD